MAKSGSIRAETSKLLPGDHLCCIYETDEEHRAILTPYLRDGLERNEKVVYIVDARTADTVVDYLRQDGLDTQPFLDKGQLVILSVAEAYMRDGRFDPERMISLLRLETDRASSEGYAALRVTGEMSWALKGLPGSERLIEYESKLNNFFPGSGCIAVCQYDRRRFPPELLLQVLATHPIAVIGTEVYENFHFVPPEKFLLHDFPTAILDHWIEGLRIRRLMKSGEDALRESEEQFRAIFENSKDGVLLTVPDGSILAANPPACEMLGRTEEEVCMAGRAGVVDMSDTRLPSLLEERARTGMCHGELNFIRKDGTKFPVEISSRVYKDRYGNPRTSMIFRDVTLQRKLESQLFVSQKMDAVGRLAGGVAHDFNNMLTAIIGYCDQALNRIDGETPLGRDIGEILKAAYRCANLTQQLLAFSRKQIMLPKVINLNDVVADMDNLLRRLVGENIRLESVQEKYLWNVKVDPGQIEQVIANLVINSRDAMPRGGKLTIETTNVELDDLYSQGHENVSPGSYVRLTVSDTGCGMDAGTMARIFEPFFTTKEKGTGLGLATAYGIVKQSGGSIDVYSEPGLGTTIKVYIPRVSEEAVAISRQSAAPFEKPGGSETILVVEDEELVRKLIQQTLVQYGYDVLDAGCGDEAIDVCSRRNATIHLLLTDVVLPDITGVELSKRLAVIRPAMKVIFMSGYTSVGILQEGLLESDVEFIQKPFTSESLARKIREVLDSKSTVH